MASFGPFRFGHRDDGIDPHIKIWGMVFGTTIIGIVVKDCPAEMSSLAETDNSGYMAISPTKPVPVGMKHIIALADDMCNACCEISNQREPAHPLYNVTYLRSPEWAFDRLSVALNKYYKARLV